ncbi:hypothetical protein DASC09_057260 [Saccharomycopsis crataegensis]|uniref:Transcription initiation factor TFIID subunit 12 domain-containing protein n=1 Tax=Saccharomycopsis crataegensis TaxID=43959 RepID=A0AAV5QUZ1_9ASCO|nr:hypothetical protein DASC09_057260 [Saccharomycopsis crataegensis]
MSSNNNTNSGGGSNGSVASGGSSAGAGYGGNGNGNSSNGVPSSAVDELSPQKLPYVIKRYKQEVTSAKNSALSDSQKALHAKNAEKLKALLVQYQRAHPEIFATVLSNKNMASSSHPSNNTQSHGGTPVSTSAIPSSSVSPVSTPSYLQNSNSRSASGSVPPSTLTSSLLRPGSSPSLTEKNKEIIQRSKEILDQELEKYNKLKAQHSRVTENIQKINQILANSANVIDQETKAKALNQQREYQVEFERLKKELGNTSSKMEKLLMAHRAMTGQSPISIPSHSASGASLNISSGVNSGMNFTNTNRSTMASMVPIVPNSSSISQTISHQTNRPLSAAAVRSDSGQPFSFSTVNSNAAINANIINNNKNNIIAGKNTNNNIKHNNSKPQTMYNQQPTQQLPPQSLHQSHPQIQQKPPTQTPNSSVAPVPTSNQAPAAPAYAPYNAQQPIFSKPQLMNYLKQITLEEKVLLSTTSVNNKVIVDPDVENLADELIKDFLDEVIDFSSKLARHRNAKTPNNQKNNEMNLSDLNLNLERNWGIIVNGNPDVGTSGNNGSAVNSLERIRRSRKRNYAPTETYINKLRKVYSKKP